MDSKHFHSALSCCFFILLFSICSSDISKDRDKCAKELAGIATCLPYVSDGESKAKAPTMDCCAGLKQVLQSSKDCLCILVKDRNDPSLGFKINATLALGLPDKCHVPSNISECPDLLHLPPNSPDAKVFQEFANSNKGSGNTTAPTGGQGSSANVKSDGSGKKRLLRREMALVLMITVSLHVFAGFHA